MKIPALRSKIGDWTYYVTTLTFNQVAQYVSKVDSELHRSNSLKELIQRSLTKNHLSIKNYILNQPEMFFNSLVLAVYNDFPNWREIEIDYDDDETFIMGLLEFPGNHKIFPLDGQHRVEGIKAALIEKPELGDMKISAIFVGHSNEGNGMQRSRRLFSTLNRYAKPVTMDDIIALDEDDSVAIVTRELLETFELFTGNRVTKTKNKAIYESDKTSFTSIITLYECNNEILKLFRRDRKRLNPDIERDNKTLVEYLKFRPTEEELSLFLDYTFRFWDSFKNSFTVIKNYLKADIIDSAQPFRNSDVGGNLLFRPVGLYPLIQASIEIHKRTGLEFNQIFEKFNEINLSLNAKPWLQVLWNGFERTMIMGNQGTTKLFLIYLFNRDLIRPGELKNLKLKYASSINYEGDVENVLNSIVNN